MCYMQHQFEETSLFSVRGPRSRPSKITGSPYSPQIDKKPKSPQFHKHSSYSILSSLTTKMPSTHIISQQPLTFFTVKEFLKVCRVGICNGQRSNEVLSVGSHIN